MSALTRKSWRDVRRRPARAAFTVITIAFAVAGLWIFAMPVLMDDAMNHRIAQDRLHDVRLPTDDVVLTDAQLASLRAVPGVKAMSTRTLFETSIVDGDKKRDVLLVGVPAWNQQDVNAITVDAGSAPGRGEVVTDRMNKRSGRFSGGIGDNVAVANRTGGLRILHVAGRGDTLLFSQLVADQEAVLYTPQQTVNEIAGASGINSIEFRVDDPHRAEQVAARVRARLLDMKPKLTFPDLADVRTAGTWPGQDVFNNFATLLYVGAILALISALVLISNTMTTMVAEQTRQIAVMKAIGGRRRQIRRSFLRTALLLGVMGTGIGIGLGIPFANVVLGFIGNQFFGITPEWGVPVNALVISVVVGVGVTLLASLPALRRAARTPVLAGFASGLTAGKDDRFDRTMRRLPLPRTAQIGLRNISRRRARTYATTLQITLAVSVAVGFLALGVTIANVTAATWDTMHWDVIVSQRSSVALDHKASRLIAETNGAKEIQPILYNTLKVNDGQYESWGMPADETMFEPDIAAGRWLEKADETQHRKVVVLGRALASTTGSHVGDTLRVGTARGTTTLTVVGIDRRLMNNGTTLYLPLATFQQILGRSDTNAYWVVSASQKEPAIDTLATSLEKRLSAAGYPVSTEIHYVEKAANLDQNKILVGVLAAMGIPIALIGMIGLLNAMTMNVIERTRDVGILRCIGASSRAVRRIFRVEAIVVAFVGAAIAVPGGWLVGRLLGLFVTHLFHFGSVPYSFPLSAAVLAVVATIVLAAAVVIAPLRRASHLEPGNALRYE
jgi:putative ABC transport system permease protein